MFLFNHLKRIPTSTTKALGGWTLPHPVWPPVAARIKPLNLPSRYPTKPSKTAFSSNIPPSKSSTTIADNATKTQTPNTVYVLRKEPTPIKMLNMSAAIASLGSIAWIIYEDKKKKETSEFEMYSGKLHQMKVEESLSKLDKRTESIEKGVEDLKKTKK